jgi:hypothetical protein
MTSGRRSVGGSCASASRTLNAELGRHCVPLRVAAGSDLSFSDGGRILFDHDDGVRAVLCHAERERLYIVHQRYPEGGQRIGEDIEARLRAAYRVAYHRWRTAEPLSARFHLLTLNRRKTWPRQS